MGDYRMTTAIIGTGSCLPETIVTNDYLAGIMDTSDEWISSRTGIRERKLVKTETTAELASEAAKRALQNAGVLAEEIDLILVGTITGDYITPSTACEVQSAIGATNAMAFDINAACTGFMTALHTAHAYFQAGFANTALVIGAETLSKIMDWEDRGTCVLFGDGAGAAVVRKKETGILAFSQGADGSKGLALAGRNRRNNNPLVQTSKDLEYIQMDGQAVYKFAVTTIPGCIEEVLNKANLSVEDVAYFVLHQANIRIIQAVAKRLKISEERFPTCLETLGNISAASVPILLDQINQEGKLKKGDKIILAGFGGGLTWGATVLEW